MDLLHELRDRLRRWFGQGRLKNTKVRRLLLGGLFFALLTLIMSTQVTPQRLDVAIGQVAPRTVEAPHQVVNRLATKRKKDAAAAAIPVIQKIDPTVQTEAEGFINYAFGEVNTVRGLDNQDQKIKVQTLTARLKLGAAVSPETYAALLSAEPRLLEVARQDAEKLLRAALSTEVRRADVADLREKIDQEQPGFTVVTKEPWLKIFVKELVKSQVKTNMVDDLTETEKIRSIAAASEEPVYWQKGQSIIRKGEVVNDEQYYTLADLRLVGPQADVRSYFGAGVLSAVLIAMMALYMARYRDDLLEKDSKILLLGLIGIITLLLALLMKAFEDALGPGVGYMMPIAVNAMLVSILMDTRAALLQSAILSMLIGFTSEVDPINHALVALVGSTVAVYATSRIESRSDIYKAGGLVSLANVVTIIGIYLVKAYSLWSVQPWLDAGLGAANGLIVAMVVTGALPLLESLFGILTPLKLLELSNPNHPLLKKLLVEAPGSYHHTILVSNLCEAAAEAIGADQVLARVGAYYHDIGKTKRPYFFVENQFGGENPHDKLPPSLSALIITSHVKDGLEMAREARLPQEIIDFIPEHHGTTLVSYFYHMASKSGQSEYVLEEDFRYEGPKPRTKETAILMLADSCEASVRALRQKNALTVDQIEAQVKRIVDDRLKQGQLDNCDLTLRELDTISKVFVKVLSGVHHARVEYPEAVQAKLPAPAVAAQPANGTGEGVKNDGAERADGQRTGEGSPDGSAGEPGGEGGATSAGPGGDGKPE
ncbi:MAG TPA: HDIG domain-containing protein [Symbiobacteriaceae bacterium]|jgi:putative nucleotidyltransferase with HDIG domain|nr:HDIG domain-containing protein [Symbiobacteriaceae bacterium]